MFWFEELLDPDVSTDAAEFRRMIRAKLAGHDLACWCRLCDKHADGLPLGEVCADCAPCHADVLLRVANEEDDTQRRTDRE